MPPVRPLVLTPNPALDRVLQVDELRTGAVHRGRLLRVQAGGKGLNVVRAMACGGHPADSLAPVAGPTGDRIVAEAVEEGLDASWFRLDRGDSRTCTLIQDARPGRPTTVVNEPGPRVTDADWRAFLDHARAAAGGRGLLASCGSLPPGADPERLLEFLHRLRGTQPGLEISVDASGDLLAAVLARPDGLVIKVNDRELADQAPDGVEALVARLRDHAIGALIVTRSSGATIWLPGGCLVVTVEPVEVINDVGSGDAFHGGWLAARAAGLEPRDALEQAVRWGTANCLDPRPGAFDPSLARALPVTLESQSDVARQDP